MAKTESQRQAQRNYEHKTDFSAQHKYLKEKCVQLKIYLSPVDTDIIARLDSLSESKTSYIKRLIREDMAKNPRKIPE